MNAEIIRIDRDTWRIEDGTVRFFLLCGTERAALVDTGMNRPDARAIAESLTDLPLILINTHADPDHISGNGAFESFYMSPAEEENYRAHHGTGTLIPVREGDVIDLGGRPLRVIDLPGHTPGSIAILDAAKRILISGDSIQDGRIFMFGTRRDLGRYIESLERLADYDGLYDAVWPMHGTFPVSPGLTRNLIEGARAILDGKAEGTPVTVHGTDVTYYRFPYAGFLCDPETDTEKRMSGQNERENKDMNETTTNETTARIQDDLYNAVNGKWMKTAVIPDDRPRTGGFSDLDQNVEKTMMADFRAFADGTKTTDIPEMRYAVALYKKVLDADRRNREGIAPVLPLLEKIRGIRTVDDLNRAACDLFREGVPLPVRMYVDADMEDATKHSFIVQGADIILPDTTFYAEDHPSGKQLLSVYADMASKVLAYTPLSEAERKTVLDGALAFDALVAKKVKSQLEWAEYYKNHNPMSLDEVAAFTAPFDLKAFVRGLYGEVAPETLIVYDPKAVREMSGYFSKETFPLYLHWAYVKVLLGATECLSEELGALGRTYARTLTGVAADPVLEKQAYLTASAVYAEPVGVYYGRTYFGEEAKKDVVDLVKKIIATYKLRMERNTFLAPSTRKEAIKKLSTIEIKMGYPDEIKEIWSKLTFEEDDSLYAAMKRISRVRREDMIARLRKPVDRTEWPMPGHMVNACYNPSANDITFPAAILQKPFYSLRQSVSENLGGIGAVIGHEISHAFDNNGAKFDEKGNLKNWWTEEDFAAFEGLTKDMIAQFDGIPYHGGTVNGELVVSENIADNGGMGVTLEIMHTLPDPDFRAYFRNWARVWCMKAKEEFIRLLLARDVHSPAELRANMPPRNFPEWYEAFGVTADDRMYIAPEKRITIW